ncbi:preprotein translocase subunit SecG [Paenirhodobacter sp.]|uniref:preprotein translocase subunit SecG n=1 Tax=Paenirhodobacter sp. TaxID=1965326 RepID=UPI003D0C7B11
MQNVVLTVHLILALLLIGVVLLQRSEGGGLGMGSTGGVMTGRQAANALTKLTWIFAAGFIATSVTLTILSARQAADSSVIDRATTTEAPATTETAPAPADTTTNPLLATPPAPTDAPVTPPAADAPVTPPASN